VVPDVNTICPTYIETPLTRPYFEDANFSNEVIRRIKLGPFHCTRTDDDFVTLFKKWHHLFKLVDRGGIVSIGEEPDFPR